MGHTTGRVNEIRITQVGQMELRISCPDSVVPSAGQYLLACDLEDPGAVLGTPLFLTEKSQNFFWAVPASPCKWQPGTRLDLIGPLGHGFELPKSIQHAGLVVLGETAGRLLPLVTLAAATNVALTLFTDLRLPGLPSVLEVYPLDSLKVAIDWADFIALDVPLDRLEQLRKLFGLPHGARLPCPSQVLLTTSMPCASLAQCGACAVRARRGWKLVCEDGPVFDLNTLEW
jgi:hypothetical protein